MTISDAIAPVAQAVENYGQRETAPSPWRTAEWDKAPAAIANRAFFSAGVESANFLNAARNRLAQTLDLSQGPEGAGMNRERFIKEMRQQAFQLGLADPAGKPNDLKNLAGATRLGLIYDMNVNAAYGRARHGAGLSQGALFAAPAHELVRGRTARLPRDWRARWTEAGESVAWKDALPYNGRFVALKTSPIWVELSRFGVPWPPFDFGSGMVLRNVSRDQAIELGLIEPDEVLAADPDPDFNQGLAATLQNVAPEILRGLKAFFGDLIRVSGNEVKFA